MGAPLLQDESELTTFFWNSSDLMGVVDSALRLVQVNPAFERQFGRKPDGSILEVCAPRDREKAKAILQQCFAGVPRAFDARVVRPNQSMRAGEWSVCTNAARTRLFIVIRDVTAKRRLEKELAQAQKLEAIGQLAAGIAHEINTPIQFVGDNLTFIGESLRELLVLFKTLRAEPATAEVLTRSKVDLAFLETELPGAADLACEGVQRVAELVRGLKEFAHQDRGEVTPTDLNHAIERTVAVTRNEWKYVAELETHFGDLPLVPCLAGGIRQVFLNLICNAAHAIAERNEREGRDRGHIRIATSCDERQVTVAISDDGPGIPEHVRARLFEPFFTTKPVGKGTGQGLAISRTIVCEKHGGQLEFDTRVGEGTTFFVRLPLQLHAPATDEAAP
ncbi:MAG: sensor histidine kinase [Myxococcota bacterium]